jgi:hypothetical protein
MFQKIFGKKTTKAKPVEHAVLVHIFYGKKDIAPLRQLEDQLQTAITQNNAGEFDGDEIAVDLSDAFLYMYGPDGDALFSLIKPILETCQISKGAEVMVRYGRPNSGAEEVKFVINGK